MHTVQVYITKIEKAFQVLGSIVVSIPACHAGDRGSIPRRGGFVFFLFFVLFQSYPKALPL